MNKRLLSIIFALAFALLLSACIEPVVETEPGEALAAQDSAMGITNPVRSMSRQELLDACGIDMQEPENAESVSYSLIDISGRNPVAQMKFTLDGREYCYRAQTVGEDTPEDISGLYYEWQEQQNMHINDCFAIMYTSGDVAYIKWINIKPAVQYSLAVTENADKDILKQLAETIFTPYK